MKAELEFHLTEANKFKEDNREKFLEHMIDYHMKSAELSESSGEYLSHIFCANKFKSEYLNESVESTDIMSEEYSEYVDAGNFIFAKTPIDKSAVENNLATTAMIFENAAKTLGITEEYTRIIVANTETKEVGALHIIEHSENCYHIVGVGDTSPELFEAFLIEFNAEKLMEDVSVTDWKKKIEQTYPEHKGTVKYSLKGESGMPNHIAAEVKTNLLDQPKSLGMYDLEKEEGHVFTEAKKVEPEEKESVCEELKQIDGKWALVSKTNPDKVLQWYKGEGKPSDEWVKSVEDRVKKFASLNESVSTILNAVESEDHKTAINSIKELFTEKVNKKKEAIKAEIAKGM